MMVILDRGIMKDAPVFTFFGVIRSLYFEIINGRIFIVFSKIMKRGICYEK